ncbi:hypothetical protein BY996DRAFT_2945626 [Phakopsora pachyrhizi]|nr:hypothetical protein BY996DRAFT_2945626 [Phakopsora pachyrhizi]
MFEYQSIIFKKRKVIRSHRPEYQLQIDGDSIYTCSNMMLTSRDLTNDEDDDEEEDGEAGVEIRHSHQSGSARLKKAYNKAVEGPWHMELKHVIRRRDRQRFLLSERYRKRRAHRLLQSQRRREEIQRLKAASEKGELEVTVDLEEESDSSDEEEDVKDLEDLREPEVDETKTERSHSPNPAAMPSSDLLRSIHNYSMRLYRDKGLMNSDLNQLFKKRCGKKKELSRERFVSMERSLDGTSLMFMGKLVLIV